MWKSLDLTEWTYWKGLGPLQFAVDGDGFPWFVDLTEGVYRFLADGNGWDRIDDNLRLPSRGIRYLQIYAAGGGRVWVEGITKADDTRLPLSYSDDYETWLTFDQSPLKTSPDSDLCLKCLADDGVWFSYADPSYWNNAFYYDYSDWRSINVGSYPQAIEVDDPTGDVWFGTIDGVDVIRGGPNAWPPAGSCLQAIEVDERNGDVWFGTDRGVYVLRGGLDAWPPVWVELEPGFEETRGADAFTLTGDAEFQMDLTLDLYVAVQLPDGTILYAPNWAPSMTPYASGVDAPIGLTLEGYPTVSYTHLRAHET